MDEEEYFRELAEVVTGTQGRVTATQYILMELALRAFTGRPDGPAIARSMFEAVSARMDQTPFETEQKASSGEARLSIASFFSVLESTLAKRAGSPPSGASPLG